MGQLGFIRIILYSQEHASVIMCSFNWLKSITLEKHAAQRHSIRIIGNRTQEHEVTRFVHSGETRDWSDMSDQHKFNHIFGHSIIRFNFTESANRQIGTICLPIFCQCHIGWYYPKKVLYVAHIVKRNEDKRPETRCAHPIHRGYADISDISCAANRCLQYR